MTEIYSKQRIIMQTIIPVYTVANYLFTPNSFMTVLDILTIFKF